MDVSRDGHRSDGRAGSIDGGHGRGHARPVALGLAGQDEDVAIDEQLGEQDRLQQVEGLLGPANGQRRRRGVVLDAEVERPDVERRRCSQLSQLRGPGRRGIAGQEAGAGLARRRPMMTSIEVPVRSRLQSWFMRRSLSWPTCAAAGRSASKASAMSMGWKLPLLIIRPSSTTTSGLSSIEASSPSTASWAKRPSSRKAPWTWGTTRTESGSWTECAASASRMALPRSSRRRWAAAST